MWAIQPGQAQARQSLHSVAVAFAPSDLAGLKAWYKADSLVLNDADAVATWNDSSSGGLDLTQATSGNRPTYRATGGPNSKPAIQFTGTTPTSLARASVAGSAIWGANACHIFVVQKQSNVNDQNATFQWQSASSLVRAYLTFGDTLYFDYGDASAGSGRRSVAQPGGWDNSWRMVQLIRESPNSGTLRIRDQGSELVNGSVTATIATGESATLNIGTGASSLTGHIAELIFYNVALSAGDRGSVETYLNSKYSLF